MQGCLCLKTHKLSTTSDWQAFYRPPDSISGVAAEFKSLFALIGNQGVPWDDVHADNAELPVRDAFLPWVLHDERLGDGVACQHRVRAVETRQRPGRGRRRGRGARISAHQAQHVHRQLDPVPS